MPEEEEENKGPMEQYEELKEETKEKEQTEQQKARKLVSTRSKIEGDYENDVLKVEFSTSPETKRTILANKPTNKEMITIMRLSAEAAKYEGQSDPEALEKMVEIYVKLSGIAAKLSRDNDLDGEFWDERVSSPTLQNFITSLIEQSQTGTGVSEEELENFRK